MPSFLEAHELKTLNIEVADRATGFWHKEQFLAQHAFVLIQLQASREHTWSARGQPLLTAQVSYLEHTSSERAVSGPGTAVETGSVLEGC